MLFKKILFATDFSDVSTRANEYVFHLRHAGAEEVVLVHVIDEREVNVVISQPSGFIAPSGDFERLVAERMRKEAEEYLTGVRISLEDAGFRVKVYLVEGVPHQEIIRIADSERVNLIVLGSHGRSDVMQMLLGSVSENVIRHAHVPVLVLRRGYEPESGNIEET